MPAKVYYMDDHATNGGESTPFKAVKLLRDAGIKDLFKKGDTVGIKIHTGDYGNSLNLRPHWIKAIAEEVQRLGGYPVIVETNTNINAFGNARVETNIHRKTASRHGINEATMECPIWLPDGVMDIEGVECPVHHGVYLNKTYVSTQMTRLDAVIVVSHFKGHPQGVFGGAIKNVGIGMASSKGKSTTHLVNHPVYGVKTAKLNPEVVDKMMQMPHPNVIDGLLTGCPFDVFEMDNGQLVKHEERCVSCSACFNCTLFSGVQVFKDNKVITAIPSTIADSAAGIIDYIGKDKFMFVNYAFDITPACDCTNFHDRPMIQNIGTFVSRDPVAVDMACIEACENLVAVPGSKADTIGLSEPNTERFTNVSSMAQLSQWQQINAAVYNGLGTSEYILVESEPLSNAEVTSWHFDYGPGKPVGRVYRDLIRSANWDLGGAPASNEPRISEELLSVKPNGIVKEISIKEE